VSPGCSIGCKLGLFSGADVGLFVVGTKKFQAGCNVGSLVGSLVEGGGEGLLVEGGGEGLLVEGGGEGLLVEGGGEGLLVEGGGEGLLVVGRKIFPSGFIVGMFVVG